MNALYDQSMARASRAPVPDQRDKPDDQRELTRFELERIIDEIGNQPPWRAKADKECEYADGNQLDTDLLNRQAALGIPPAKENIIAETIEAVCGMEAKTRTDWRLTPDGGSGGQEVADALNYKLNQAERQSRADKACSEAFASQLGPGLGWVEVSRESDPTKFPYRCNAVHRNEIWWDMSERNDKRLQKARWLLRKRWMVPHNLALVFPKHREKILKLGEGDLGEWYQTHAWMEGGTSTGLSDGSGDPRGWSIAEQEWYNPEFRRVCVYEVWYRRWTSAVFIRTPDGRVVEFDARNMAHVLAVSTGASRPQRATVARIRRAYWMGPCKLHDGFTPYSHGYYPYVPFWNKIEDSTGVPYGALRGMMYSQDTLNAGLAKLRWGMASVTTIRTKGATKLTDAEFRKMSARVDADFVLDREHMAEEGAMFERIRDYQLTEQHYKMIEDARASIQRVGPGSAAFLGKEGTARSGIQEQEQTEQSNQRLAGLMDEFKEGRTTVGEMLLSMLIEDIGKEREVVVIEGDAIRPERTVTLNGPELDPATGMPYLSNDVQRTRLKVSLEDVPTTSSFRAQQLNAMSEVLKSMPEGMQVALMPFAVALMDLPYKREVVEAVRSAGAQQSEQQIQQRIAEAVKQAGMEVKMRELELKYSPEMMEAQVRKLVAEAFKLNGTALYEANQTALALATNPAAAPLADHVAQIAGFVKAPGGEDPNFPVQGLEQPVAAAAANMPPAPPPGAEGEEGAPNTNPTRPPQPPGPGAGIETPGNDGAAAPGGFQAQ